MGNFPLCLLFFILIAMASVAAETYLEKYGKLREELINPLKYNYKVRPENETFIKVTLDLRSLDKLDIASQSLSTTFLLYMSWIDERLTWPSTTDIEYMIYSIKEIWTPNLVITNYMDNVGLMGIIEDGPVPLRVSNEGQVVWALREAATTTCEVNVMYYPYDHQTCNIEIMEWAHPISEVDLLPLGINKQSYLEDGEWLFEGSSQHSEEEIGSYNQTYRRIKYTFEFHRYITWYIPLMIVPLFVLSLLMPGIFLVPEDSGEKVAYGLTVMLSFTVISSYLFEKLPTVSTENCLVGVYIATSMTFGAAMIVGSLALLSYGDPKGSDKKKESDKKESDKKESDKKEKVASIKIRAGIAFLSAQIIMGITLVGLLRHNQSGSLAILISVPLSVGFVTALIPWRCIYLLLKAYNDKKSGNLQTTPNPTKREKSDHMPLVSPNTDIPSYTNAGSQ